MSKHTADIIYLCISLGSFTGLLICIGVGLFFAYTKMDLMLSHLKNCPAITIRIFLMDTGPSGRLHLLGAITGLIIWPRLYLRDGGACADDLKRFPANLKRKLITLHWATCVFFSILLILYVFVELGYFQ